MAFFRRGRFLLRLTRELSHKYTLSLVFGFLLGLFGSIAMVRFSPYIYELWLTPVDRIGLIGDFTPTTLPLNVQNLISEGLTNLNSDGSVKPALATSWTITNSGKTYIFHLNSELKWSDGKPVLARDVNYNIKSVTFVATGPNTLKADLAEAFTPFLTLVSKPILLPGLIGLSAYKVSSIQLKGDTVNYLKLAPVSAGNGRVKEFRFYTTEEQAITAFKRGDVDILEDLTSPGDLVNWSRIKITPTKRFNRIVTIFFNLKNSQLSERGFREGLGYGIPDLGEEKAVSPIAKNSWAYTDQVKHFTFDESQAKKLLKNSEEGTSSAHFTLSTFAPYEPLAEKIAKSWTALGVITSVRVVNDISNGFDVLLSAQNIPPDPDQYPFWHSTQSDTNITGYVNVKIDKLLEDGRREMDPEARYKIYADFAKRLVDDAPALFLYYPKMYTIERQK